jgi:ABC-2 type transport system permease protein
VSEYLAGMVLSSSALGLIGLGILIIIAGLGFGYNFFLIGLSLLPFLFILFIFGIAMGIFVTAMIFRLGPAAEWLGWPIPFILSIFSGVFYPISTLPAPLQYLAKILPPAYVFDSLRAIMGTGKFSSTLAFNLIMGGILAIAYLFLMYYFFLRVYRRNLKSGSIARFSAEQY